MNATPQLPAEALFNIAEYCSDFVTAAAVLSLARHQSAIDKSPFLSPLKRSRLPVGRLVIPRDMTPPKFGSLVLPDCLTPPTEVDNDEGLFFTDPGETWTMHNVQIISITIQHATWPTWKLVPAFLHTYEYGRWKRQVIRSVLDYELGTSLQHGEVFVDFVSPWEGCTCDVFPTHLLEDSCDAGIAGAQTMAGWLEWIEDPDLRPSPTRPRNRLMRAARLGLLFTDTFRVILADNDIDVIGFERSGRCFRDITLYHTLTKESQELFQSLCVTAKIFGPNSEWFDLLRQFLRDAGFTHSELAELDFSVAAMSEYMYT